MISVGSRTCAGQATVEYAGIGLLVLVLLFAGLAAARSALPIAALATSAPSGDGAQLALAARHTPLLALEAGDDVERPVDSRHCRALACSEHATRTVLFAHVVRRNGFIYLEYWEYLPDSRFAHTGLPPVDGFHRDDWEGVIVKLRGDGSVVGARATAHLGFTGRHPWWDLAHNDWAPYPAVVYRAAGSHAGGFSRSGVDMAGDRWNGTAALVRPTVVPADEAMAAGAGFDPGSVPPWDKDAWDHPETVVTGHPGDHASYARYARWWADVCLVCRYA